MRSLSLDRTGLCSPSGVDAFALTDSNSALGNNGLLQLSNHVVQNCHTGEQNTHWDMLKKATKFEFSLFNMSQCVICSPVWRVFRETAPWSRMKLPSFVNCMVDQVAGHLTLLNLFELLVLLHFLKSRIPRF